MWGLPLSGQPGGGSAPRAFRGKGELSYLISKTFIEWLLESCNRREHAAIICRGPRQRRLSQRGLGPEFTRDAGIGRGEKEDEIIAPLSLWPEYPRSNWTNQADQGRDRFRVPEAWSRPINAGNSTLIRMNMFTDQLFQSCQCLCVSFVG